VKFAELGYDEAAWVPECEVPDEVLAAACERAQESTALNLVAASPGRPNPLAPFAVLDESPPFGDGLALRSYQLDGLNWLRQCYVRRKNSILGDEMGLGKTVQSVAILAQLRREFSLKGPFLVVAPNSTLANWYREFQLWAPQLNVVLYHS
jgi:hypothetical protein